MSELQTWGRYRRTPQKSIDHGWRDAPLPSPSLGTMLPYGQGRSYGDVAQNSGGRLVSTRNLDRFMSFDSGTGRVRAESGVRLCDILEVATPLGWYLAVAPGTQFVSLGGAIANDVHGKNHHRAGTFGHHVLRFELLRSDGSRLLCSRDEHPDWFAATVGGLGLTGLVTWAEISLRRIRSTRVDVETIPFASLSEYLALCDSSDETHEYTVGWFDCFSYHGGRFRGLFTRANHADASTPGTRPARALANVPFELPLNVVRPVAMRMFNRAYHRLGRAHAGRVATMPLDRFLYPLDRIGHWNRLYGKLGFLQLQCVIPLEQARSGIEELLDRIAAARQGTFLAVLKRFGAHPPCGILSFPRSGVTLALDFPYRGDATLQLFDALHDSVRRHGGRIYPAKDACMTAATFEAGYPDWRRLEPFVDPAFSSDFWARVTCGHAK
ncbi:MAG: FAD-binding oxidoreductase [Burkholderiales bacterium]|nr:FAD-binding oxidoreductase [Burkholderiales bacterium]